METSFTGRGYIITQNSTAFTSPSLFSWRAYKQCNDEQGRIVNNDTFCVVYSFEDLTCARGGWRGPDPTPPPPLEMKIY